MGQPQYHSKTLSAASANNIVLSQTPLAAGDLTLNGSTVSGGVATLDTGRQVLFTFAANETGHSFVVYGQNRSGGGMQETIAGTAAGTVATTQSFYKVTRISISAAATGAMTVGTNGIGSTEWKIVNWDDTVSNLGIAVTVSGTVNYTVEYTYEDPSGTYPNPSAATSGYSISPGWPIIPFPTAWPLTGLTALAVAAEGALLTPVAAIRLTINSGTGAAQMQIIQSGFAE